MAVTQLAWDSAGWCRLPRVTIHYALFHSQVALLYDTGHFSKTQAPVGALMGKRTRAVKKVPMGGLVCYLGLHRDPHHPV